MPPATYSSAFARFRLALAADPAADLRPIYDTVLAADPARAAEFLLEALCTRVVAGVRAGQPAWIDDEVSRFPELRDRPDDVAQLFAEKNRAERDRLYRTRPAAAAGDRRPPALPMLDWVPVAAGGQGQVWQGRHRLLDRVEAVKVLHAADAPSGPAPGRAEALALARVDHPNVCRVYGFEDGYDGRPCLRMAFIDGTAADIWRDQHGVDVYGVARLVSAVAGGVQAVHDAGFVHADLKPQNIVVDANGKPVVVDFGYARLPGPVDPMTGTTEGYCAPERLTGHPLTFRADVYSLGIVLARLAAAAGLPAGRAARRDLAAVVARATADDPDARYPSAAALAADLDRLNRGGEELAARPHGVCERAGRTAARHKARLAVAALVVFAGGAGGTAVRQARAAAARAERDAIAARLAAGLSAATPAAADPDAVEADLARLAELDAGAAADYGVRHVDALLGRTPIDLARVERAVGRAAAGPGGAGRLGSPVRTEYFRVRVAREAAFDKLDGLLRADAARVPDLERAARIEAALGQVPGRPGVRMNLVRAYLAAGDLAAARSAAGDLLADPTLLPAWRVVAARDLVWAAVAAGNPAVRAAAAARLAGPGLGRPGDRPPAFAELAVEDARLATAAGDPAAAAALLDAYLARPDLDVKPESGRTENRRFPDGPAVVNVPAAVYLEAAILRGFLPNRLAAGWAAAFDLVRRYPIGTSYEAAVLGSLSGRLTADDARAMMVSTADNVSSPSPVARQIRELAADKTALGTVTSVLRGAWASPRGRDMAERIATRAMPFSEFLHAQIRLWIYEGLIHLTRGPGAVLTADEDAVLWGVAEDFRTTFAVGELAEADALAVVTFARGPGVYDPSGWPAVAAKLPPRLRGPVAYVLGRAYLHAAPSLGRFVAPVYFASARDHAAAAPDPAALIRLLAK